MGSTGNSTASRLVLVVGNNRIATSITTALYQSGSYEIHQIVPRRTSVHHTKGITVHESDLSSQSLRHILSTIHPDVFISTASGGDFAFQKLLIDIAIETKVLRFIPAEVGHDSLNTRLQERLPPSKERARTIEYLRQCSGQGKIEWVGLAMSCLLDHGILSGNLGFDLKWHSATLHGSGDEHFAASSTPFVGEAVFAAVQHWEEVKNQYLHTASMSTTTNTVLAALEVVTGKQWEAGRSDVEDCVREAERRVERGWPDAGMFLMERSVLYDEGLDALKPFLDHDAKDMLKLRGEDVEGLVKEVVHQHKHYGKGDCGCG
ncbi:hypothetical protein LTS14_008409 [Recurvomyces mirabilis]|uniref:uncharacterized protein n=1 Tax=Recurvomyces mirabilis TaxID=574656 RepID=UPI002DDECB85|nr:hypothetical protein LTS14_008409 [Recurvomyces mirabilis]